MKIPLLISLLGFFNATCANFLPIKTLVRHKDSIPIFLTSTQASKSSSIVPSWAQSNSTYPTLYTIVQEGGDWTSSGTTNLRGYDWNILNGTLRVGGTNGKFQIEDLHNQKRFQIYREHDTTYIGGQNTKYEYTSPLKIHHDAPTNSFIMFPEKLQLNQTVEFAGGGNTQPPVKIAPSSSLLASPQSGAIEQDGNHLYWTDGGGNRTQLDNRDKVALTQLSFLADSNLDQKIIFNSTPESKNGNAGIFWGQYRVNTTGPDTTNNVLSMGINWDQSRGTQEYIRLGMESHYENFGQPAWQEWHAPEIRTQDGTIFRPSSWIGPKGYAVGSWLYRSESLTWLNSPGTRQLFGFTEGGNFFSNVYGWSAAIWSFNVHDANTDELKYGFRWQIAESGEAIFSGNITSFSFSNPIVVNTNSAYGLLNILNANHANGLYANGTQKRLYLAQGQFDASEYAFLNLTNSNTTTGSSVLQLQTHIASTGSPYVEFYVYGGIMWRMGIDNQEDQNFKIGVNDWTSPAFEINNNTSAISLHATQYSTNGLEDMMTIKDGVIGHRKMQSDLPYYDVVFKDSASTSLNIPTCIGIVSIEDNTTGTLSYEVNACTANGDIAGYNRKLRFKKVEGKITLMPELEVVSDQEEGPLTNCSVAAIVSGNNICIRATGINSGNVFFRLNAGVSYSYLPLFYL